MPLIFKIYKASDVTPEMMEEFNKLKKMEIVQVYQTDGYIAVGRWTMATVTLRREIKSYQVYHTSTA